ncbi:MAG: hypothetical protein CMO55_25735 [Verrucomicrobiales bacterium]|nr:hypothetical protein [Verrucomicrobiales bacterium]
MICEETISVSRKRVIAVSGAGGFIGSHLSEWAEKEGDVVLVELGRELFDSGELSSSLEACETVVHLAGMNRGDDDEIYGTNVRLAEQLVEALTVEKLRPNVVYVSSIQRDSSNAYGRSKREAEKIFQEWAERVGASLSILIVPNVFGTGCRAFYNSVVATFCHQLSNGDEPKVFGDRELELLDVEILIQEIVGIIKNPPTGTDFFRITGMGRISTSELLQLLSSFQSDSFDEKVLLDLADPLYSALYRTFLSYAESK